MSVRLCVWACLVAVGCGDAEQKASGGGEGAGTTDPVGTTDTDTDPPEDTSEPDDSGEPGGTGPVDADGDGYTTEEDCDDTDAAVHPGATEVPGDGIDNDCDPSTCAGSGFSDAPTSLALPEGYGDRTFSGPGNNGDCAGERPRWTFVDLTGDSRKDIVVVRSPCADADPGLTTWDVHAATDTGYEPAVAWSLPSDITEGALRAPGNPGGCAENGRPRWALRDLDGDARPELVVTQNCEDDTALGTLRWDAYHNTGTGFAARSDFTLPGGYTTGELDDFSSVPDCGRGRPGFTLLDTDQDGDDDLVVTASPCGDSEPGWASWTVHENTGAGFDSAATSFTLPEGYAAGTFFTPGNPGSCADGIPRWTSVDLDGDGWLDAVVTWLGCDEAVVGTTEWHVHQGSVGGFDAAPTPWTLPSGFGPNAFDAIAGDAQCEDLRPRYGLRDLDGDGRQELVVMRSPCEDDGVGETHWSVYRSSGTAFSATPDPWTLPPGYGAETFHREGAVRQCAPEVPGWTLEDFNGDGLLDVFITASACLDDAVGDTEWAVHEGGCSL